VGEPAEKTNPNMHLVEDSDPVPMCDEEPYPRLRPGEFTARCVEARTYRDKRFRRWICRLKFWIVPEGPHVFGFLNLGSEDKPRVGRGSEYRRAWIEASGAAPRRRQGLAHSVFRGKIFQVRIDDVSCRHDGRAHHQADVYSTVKEIIKRTWP
jgi:hypothetical protein